LEAIRCRVRQRTVQYELLEIRDRPDVPRIKAIRQVMNPITREFVPVEKALHFGWLVCDEDGDFYVDGKTGYRLSIDTALASGLIQLAEDSSLESSDENFSDSSNLLLIERITCTWCPVRITSYQNTNSKDQCALNEALQNGWIQLKTGEPVILDHAADQWITTEEAAGRGIIQIVPVDPNERFYGPLEETYSCRVFRITSVRPGGEPNIWMDSTEAARRGLFNWKTGDIAAEWESTEEKEKEASTDAQNSSNTNKKLLVTRWLSLLAARKARWIRLRIVSYPREILRSKPISPTIHSTHRVLSTHIHLVAPSSVPVTSALMQQSPKLSGFLKSPAFSFPTSTPPIIHDRLYSGRPSVGLPTSGQLPPRWNKPLRSAPNPEKWSRPSSLRSTAGSVEHNTLPSQAPQRVYRSHRPNNRLLIEWSPDNSSAPESIGSQ
uniref:SH3 domain-containing protein n=1 Tax=Echinostoma caproni TaxID=27848 RepID=A0A183AEB6_9TREM